MISLKSLSLAYLAALAATANAQFSVRTVNTNRSTLEPLSYTFPDPNPNTYNNNSEAILAAGPTAGSYLLDFIDLTQQNQFPANTQADNFVLEATGFLVVPAAGTYFFGVNSDDGFRLTIGGSTIGATVNEEGVGEPGDTSDLEFDDPRGPGNTTGAFTFAAPGNFPIRLTFFELGGGEVVRLYQADDVNAANARNLGDTTQANTLDVVPEPGSMALLALGSLAFAGLPPPPLRVRVAQNF